MLTRRHLIGGITSGLTTYSMGRTGISMAFADAPAEWAKVVAEAKGQSLNLTTDPYTAHRSVVEVFAKRFPDIKVQINSMHPNDFGPKVITEQKNNLFAWDCWWGTCASMNHIALPANALDKVSDFLILPEVKDTSNWSVPDFQYTSKNSTSIFVHTHFLVNYGAYNIELVPGGILTVDNILDPSLKRMISIRVPNRPHGGTMMLASIAKKKGIDYVERLLTAMEPIYVDNDRQNTMSVIRGDTAVGIGTAEETLYECHKQSGCGNVKPFPESVMHSRGVSVLRNAPHKAAATVWVNWLLSKEGQDTFVQEWGKYNPTGAFSMRKDVSPDPKHRDSMPDLTQIDQYIGVSLDSGWEALNAVIKIYNKVRR